MKYLLPLSLLAVCLSVISGCGESSATPVATPTVRDVSAKQGDPTATSTDSSSKAENQSEPPSTNSSAGETGTVSAASSPAKDIPQGAAPAKSTEVRKISFDDLNCGMQADIVFRPWMVTERVKELDGQQVRVVGYMNPDVKQNGITEFILLRNTECKFGPSGQADHLIRVTLDPGVTTNFSSKPVQVIGKLTLNPFDGPDGKTWCIFDMTGKSVGPPQR